MGERLPAELRSWLIRAGFPSDIELTEMHRGMGSTAMWSFLPKPESAALVVRMFGADAGAAAEREYLAMDAAARHGLPVPGTVTRGTVRRRPVLVSTFLPGEPASQTLQAHPERAQALGVAMGEALGRLHKVAAPAGLAETTDAWIDRGGPALSPVRWLLDAVPGQDRLLHLDYHPANVLVQDIRVSGIIDWENTLAGPPHMDLARTLAILRAAALGNLVPRQGHEALARFERGLVAGHTQVIGIDPAPALSAAWGLAVTVEDLTRQIGKSGGLITRTLVERLAEERDALIRTLVTQDAPDRTSMPNDAA